LDVLPVRSSGKLGDGKSILKVQEFLSILTNKISVLEVESVQLIACLLRVDNILVDNKRCALRVRGNPLSYLARKKLSVSIQDPDLDETRWMFRSRSPNGAEFSEEVEQILCRNVVADIPPQVLDVGASGQEYK
jgi:hypothetical protein